MHEVSYYFIQPVNSLKLEPFKQEYEDIYKWTEDTNTSGPDVFEQARKTFTSELKKIIKNKPTVREVIKVWEIHFLNRLIRLHTKYKK